METPQQAAGNIPAFNRSGSMIAASASPNSPHGCHARSRSQFSHGKWIFRRRCPGSAARADERGQKLPVRPVC